MSSEHPSGPPPPYPGYSSTPGAPPPAAAAYNDPSDPYKGFSGSYSNPAQPGMGYSQPYPPSQPAAGGYPPQPVAGSYAPQPGYGQPAGYTHNTTVVVSQPHLAVTQTFREMPVHCSCPHCRAEVVTGTHFESGTFTWVICCVLWWIGCGLGCCFIPFCLDSCKDVIHTCPNCHQQIARYSRM